MAANNLKNAYEEGAQIRDYMERQRDLINVSFRSRDIPSDYIREKMRYFDFVHFANHLLVCNNFLSILPIPVLGCNRQRCIRLFPASG